MESAKDTYKEVTLSGSLEATSNRNNWALNGFHLASRGDKIDHFTSNSPAVTKDAERIGN